MYRAMLLLLGTTLFLGCSNSDAPSPQKKIDEDTIQKPAIPSISFNNKMERIAVFIRLANQIRFFHPSDGAVNTIWERFISYGIYRVALTESHVEFVSTLRQLFADVAPSLEIDGLATMPAEKPSGQDKVAMWRNKGYQDDYFKSDSSSVYERSWSVMPFEEATRYVPFDEVNYRQSLFGIVDIEFPVVVKVVNGQTQPESRSPSGDIDQYQIDVNFSNVYARLAAAGQLWSVLRDFYPYFGELDLNWEEELVPMLTECVDSVDDCMLAMRKLLALTQDNHNWLLSDFSPLGYSVPPMAFIWQDDKVLLAYKQDDNLKAELGDELVSIDGVDISVILQQRSPFTPRSQHKKLDYLVSYDLLRGESSKSLELQLRDTAGALYSMTVSRTEYVGEVYQALKKNLTFANEDKVKKLNNGIVYVNLSVIEQVDINSTIAELQSAKAVVLDLRNYPNWGGWQGILAHFTQSTIRSLPLEYPKLNYYPEQYFYYPSSFQARIEPIPPFLDMPVVVLSSRYSISQNEHALGFVQDANIPVLGETTYGINGDVSYIHLLGGKENGGVSVIFTGARVTQHDGTPLRGVGLVPDILSPLTIASIKNSEDIQLQQAVEYLQKSLLE